MTPRSDKEKILKNLADISSARVASDEDKVQRKVAKKVSSASLEKEYISNPYGTAVNMGQIKFPKKARRNQRVKKVKNNVC